MRKIVKKWTSIILCIALLLSITVVDVIPAQATTKSYSLYVKNPTVSKSGNTVKVTYTAGNVPNGATCYIGYEDWTGTIRKEQRIGAKGRHTIIWT